MTSYINMLLVNNSGNSKFVETHLYIVVHILLFPAECDWLAVCVFSWVKTGPSENPAATERADRREAGETLSGENRTEDKTGLGADGST